MATARDVITRALRKGHVVGSAETPSDEQISAGLDTFNDMLEAWRDEGIDLGLSTLTLNTTLAVDAGVMRALVSNLAVEAANDEGVAVPQTTAVIAERSRAALAGRLSGVRHIRFDRALRQRRRFDVSQG
ncbi:MAG: hypothetical protein ACT4O5_12115 [Gammaproteobacteria bacterium]